MTDVERGFSLHKSGERSVFALCSLTIFHSLDELTKTFLRTNRHAFVVLDDDKRLIGIVSLSDLRRVDEEQRAAGLSVGEIMTRSLITAFPDETLDVVLRRMGPGDLSRLPVVVRDDPTRLLGVLRRNDLVRAYSLALSREYDPG